MRGRVTPRLYASPRHSVHGRTNATDRKRLQGAIRYNVGLFDRDEVVMAGSPEGTRGIDDGGDALRASLTARIGFGALHVTGEGRWGPPADPGAAVALLRRAVEIGVQLIDTADSYGPEVSERLVREALYPYRLDVLVATKGGYERPGPNEWVPNARPDYLRQACEDSLRRLGLEQIPLYQLHTPDPDVPLEESIGCLGELRAEGKIRYIGVCNVRLDQLRLAQREATIACVQNEYSVVSRASESIVDACDDEGLLFLPWAPIRDVPVERIPADLTTRYHASPRQLALAWLLARSPVIAPIPGTSKISHLEENWASTGITLSAEDEAAIGRAMRHRKAGNACESR